MFTLWAQIYSLMQHKPTVASLTSVGAEGFEPPMLSRPGYNRVSNQLLNTPKVSAAGVEPARLSAQRPQRCGSTNFPMRTLVARVGVEPTHNSRRFELRRFSNLRTEPYLRLGDNRLRGLRGI